MNITLAAIGLDAFDQFLDTAPEAASSSMRMAINDVSKGLARRRAEEEMEDQVNFPSGYVKQRVFVEQLATTNNLEAVIRGRDRPTSLARFIVGGPRRGMRNNIHVRVARNGTGRVLRKAFVVDLKGRSGDGSNIGLAVRLKPGEALRNTTGAKIFKSDKHGSIALLYGPSVDQVFREVSYDIIPDVEEAVLAEFFRQFDRLIR